MKILPGSPPPPHAFRSSLIHRNRSFEIEICAESLCTVNSSTACEAEEDSIHNDLPPQTASLRSSSHNDGIGFSDYGDGKAFYAEKLQFFSSHRFKANTDKDDDDDDDDGMQWANAMGPLQAALRSFGYGDSNDLGAAKMASGKENKARFPCKLASFPSAIAQQQHAGPIKPNSGPFSGPVRVTARPNSAAKANMAPSIIPVKLFRKNMLGFDVCEPMSPEVTCFGRVKVKESTQKKHVRATTDDKSGALAEKVQKGMCFDTKNQLCGKKVKGRKKKKIADKPRSLSRRRFASKDGSDSKNFSSSLSSELGETRREKAASLARSLTSLLQDVRQLKKVDVQYVPSVPPPNSLLLMRGSRMRDEICSPIRGNVEEATVDDHHVRDSPRVETPDEDSPREANVKNLRNSAPLHLSLLELIGMEDEDFFTSDMEGPMMTQRTHAIAQGTSLSERENFEAVENDDKKNKSVDEGSSLMPPPRAPLWQRRGISELMAIEVEQRTKQKINLQLIIR